MEDYNMEHIRHIARASCYEEHVMGSMLTWNGMLEA